MAARALAPAAVLPAQSDVLKNLPLVSSLHGAVVHAVLLSAVTALAWQYLFVPLVVAGVPVVVYDGQHELVAVLQSASAVHTAKSTIVAAAWVVATRAARAKNFICV